MKPFSQKYVYIGKTNNHQFIFWMIFFRKLTTFILCLSLYTTVSAKQTDSILLKLNDVMDNKAHYIAIKEQRIENIKQMLTIENLLPRQKYEIHQKLHNEYHKYCTDSSIVYIRKNREIARQLRDPELINETAIYLSLLYSTVGLYIEASELLHGINRRRLSKNLLTAYYDSYAEFYSHYGQSNKVDSFYALSGQYRDSVLFTLDTLSFQYRLERTSRRMFSNYTLDQEQPLLALLDEAGDSHDRAHVAWLLGYMYHREVYAFNRKEYIDTSKQYYAIAVISDVEHSVRDHASMQSLAIVFFEQDEITLANKFIYYAFEDALACNVRYRIMDASTNYPIINAIYQQQETKQMTRLYSLLIVISILLFILVITLVVFFGQNGRLSRMSRALSQANSEFKELHGVKDKLFSIVAHDLRSPISSLMNMLKLINTNELDTEIQAQLLSDISCRVDDTYGLLDNLLYWAKSQMQGMAPSPVYFDIQNESQIETNRLQSAAAAKKISLNNCIDDYMAYADRDMFAVVIRNLVSNAIKYTSAAGEITLSSELSGDMQMLVISVKDGGTGMSQDVQNKLFKLSETKSRRGTNNESGTGVGLVLCADFVKINVGNIWFTSKEGEGSTFSFTVPVKELRIEN